MPTSVLQLIFPIFDMIFDFWPFLILAPLQNKKSGIRNMIYVWGMWAIIRILLFFNPDPLKSILIPEPLSTILFFGTGGALLAIYFGVTWWKNKRIRSRAFGLTKEGLLELSPGDFEQMTAELFRSLGHQAIITRAIGDHGVDVVVKAKNGEKWVVQCKRWRTAVGEPIVRDFYGVMQHEKAAQGIIFALSGYTQAAYTWAKGKPIHLYNGNDFLRLCEKAKKQQENESRITN